MLSLLGVLSVVNTCLEKGTGGVNRGGRENNRFSKLTKFLSSLFHSSHLVEHPAHYSSTPPVIYLFVQKQSYNDSVSALGAAIKVVIWKTKMA